MSKMTPEQIDKAEAAGIITAAQARAMRADLDPGPAGEPGPEIGQEEDLRFFRSFSDVFIGLGLILLVLGLRVLTGLLNAPVPGLGFAVAAGLCFLLAHHFGRKQRAHFPTLILALAFLVFVGNAAADASIIGVPGAIISVIAMAVFYWRIRLPFCIALIAVTLLYLLFAGLNAVAPDLLKSHFGPVLVAAGLTIFGAALAYDTRDVQRRTRFADNAFWLHVLAAPLIIHGLVFEALSTRVERLFGVIPTFTVTRADALIILIAVAVIAFIGLAINRRALIVSSLIYAGFAVAFLVRDAGVGLGTTLSITLLLIGAGVVGLGVGWHPMRNQIIRLLPRWKVFPPPFVETKSR